MKLVTLSRDVHQLSVNTDINLPHKIFTEYADLFKDELGKLRVTYSMKIDPDVQPVVRPTRRIPVAMQDRVKAELERMTDLGVITPVSEPTEWVSSMVATNKKQTKDIRICIDPQDLNTVEYCRFSTLYVMMAKSTGYGPRKEFGSRWNRLCFDGDEKNYELWETKFLAHLRQLGLKSTILSEPDDDEEEEDAEKNEDAYAELIQLLDDKSLSLVMRDAADDGRKALKILREHYAGTGKPRVINLYTELTSLQKAVNESVTDYVIRAETAITALRNAKETLSDGLLIAMVLKGLPDSFKPFSIHITQSDETITFTEFKTKLRSYESTEKFSAACSEDDSVMKVKARDGNVNCKWRKRDNVKQVMDEEDHTFAFKVGQVDAVMANGVKEKGLMTSGIALRKGTAQVRLRDNNGQVVDTMLMGALYVPSFPQDIFSVKAATSQGATVIFKEDSGKVNKSRLVEFITKSGTECQITDQLTCEDDVRRESAKTHLPKPEKIEPQDIRTETCDPSPNTGEKESVESRCYPQREKRPPQYLRDYECGINSDDDHAGDVPHTLREAISSPESELWSKAMQEEMNSLKENDTFTLTTLPEEDLEMYMKEVTELSGVKHTSLLKCFMVDKDMSEINALNDVFPESDVLLCWYHVLQAIVRWLMKSDSSVSGPQRSSIRKEIIDYFKKMKACPMKADFDRMSKQFLKEFSHYKELCNYFQRYWEPISHRWADYGRCYNHGNSETNNLIERFFHRLKYQFLSGIRNRRLDDLLDVLLCKTETYFQNLPSGVFLQLPCGFERLSEMKPNTPSTACGPNISEPRLHTLDTLFGRHACGAGSKRIVRGKIRRCAAYRLDQAPVVLLQNLRLPQPNVVRSRMQHNSSDALVPVQDLGNLCSNIKNTSTRKANQLLGEPLLLKLGCDLLGVERWLAAITVCRLEGSTGLLDISLCAVGQNTMSRALRLVDSTPGCPLCTMSVYAFCSDWGTTSLCPFMTTPSSMVCPLVDMLLPVRVGKRRMTTGKAFPVHGRKGRCGSHIPPKDRTLY
ncbi:hypothetical protein F2P79_020360 [Pimephales promelas]|nr:hypothetical protein F2P79_020360 [Pimephales promelas]